MKLTLAEHIVKSREVVAANKAKGNRHAELFATMYAQPSRFIEEVLQNTEDAYARKKSSEDVNKVRFFLFDDWVEVHHNGKDFDEQDLMSVTTFANTTKKNNNDVNQIGKFGIGFKSVFSITDTPEIHCDPYHFSIVDYEVLEQTKLKKPTENFKTLIILPFKKKNQAACYEAVYNGLSNLSEYSLLFLKKIDCIEIYISGVLSLKLERKCTEIARTFRVVSIRKTKAGESFGEQESGFLVFSKEPQSEKQQPELAFKFENESGIFQIKPIRNAPVFVYFPTRMNSGLNFIINAPFTTNPLREYIPFDAHIAPENIKLLKETADLFVRALKTMKQKGWFNLSLIAILPITGEHGGEITGENELKVYRTLYDALLDFYKREPAIPVSGGKLAVAGEVMIPHSEDLFRLLHSSDIQKLYQKKSFIDPEINEKQFEIVRNFFSETMKISTADAQGFGFRLLINNGILQEKSLSWLKRFYAYIHKNQDLWDVQHAREYYSLRYAAVFYTQDNQFQPAFDEESRLRVFLPEGKKCYLPIINKKILNDSECLAFFRDLGIKEPEPADDVEYNIIPEFAASPGTYGAGYLRSVEKILEVYRTVSAARKEKMVELLKKASWVYCTAMDSGKKAFFKKPGETYIFSADLNDYFENYDGAFVVEPVLLKKLNKKFQGAFSMMLEGVGVRKFPAKQTSDEKLIEIDGFDHFLKAITLKRSKAFINLLLSFTNEFSAESVTDYLKNKSWIYTKNMLFEPPQRITKSEISLSYNFSEPEKNRLCNFMGISEDTQQNIERYIDWNPSLSPDAAAIFFNQDQIKPDGFNPGLFSGANLELLVPSFNEDRKMDENTVYSNEDLAKIQRWSCSYVKNSLKKVFTENNYIIESFEHADLVMKNNGRISKYIFVCGKTDLLNAFPLNVSQLARIIKLFRSAEDTCMYFVNAAGTQNASIKVLNNPFVFLMGGELLSGENIWIKGFFDS